MNNLGNQGTIPLPNLKVLLMKAPSFHSCLILLVVPAVLSFSAPCPIQLGLSLTHFTFNHFTFTSLKIQVMSWPGPVGDHLEREGLHYIIRESAPSGATLPRCSKKKLGFQTLEGYKPRDNSLVSQETTKKVSGGKRSISPGTALKYCSNKN